MKDRADVAAADVAHFLVIEVVDAFALQQDLAGRHAARWLQQANDGGAGERLACTGLPHDTQDLAGCDREGNVVQSAQGTATARELDNEVFDF